MIINAVEIHTKQVKRNYSPGSPFCCQPMQAAFASIINAGLPKRCPYCEEGITVIPVVRNVPSEEEEPPTKGGVPR